MDPTMLSSTDSPQETRLSPRRVTAAIVVSMLVVMGSLALLSSPPLLNNAASATDLAVSNTSAKCLAAGAECDGGGGSPCMTLLPDSWTDTDGSSSIYTTHVTFHGHTTVMVASQAACCAAAAAAKVKAGLSKSWWTWNPSKTSPDGTCDIWLKSPGIRRAEIRPGVFVPVVRPGYKNSMSGWSLPPGPEQCCPGSNCFQPDTGPQICVHQDNPGGYHPTECNPQVRTNCCANGYNMETVSGDKTRGKYCNQISGCSGPCPPPAPPTPAPTPDPAAKINIAAAKHCPGTCKSDADCHNHGIRPQWWNPFSHPQGCNAWQCGLAMRIGQCYNGYVV